MSTGGNTGSAASLRWNGAPAVSLPAPTQELEPLIQPLSPPAVGKFIAATGIFLLVMSWCVLDNWNEMVSGSLFQVGVAPGTNQSHGKPQYFKYPLTLTFLEFYFMCLAFSVLWLCTSTNKGKEVHDAKKQICSAPWPIIVVSHIFGTFWLQALMMPAQVMSISFFAATRALEVPIVASARSWALRQPYGGHALQTLGLVTAANMLLFYSYLQMEGCMCIWEGHGIFLSGITLYAIYFLLLAMPAINTVGQETIMTVWNMNPFLMLALQNGFACVAFCPVLLLENTGRALRMIYKYEEVSLLVLWICIQAFAFALVTVLLVRCLDSFWAVSLRSMRVVYWWCWQLIIFYVSSNSLLSVSHPKISGWSFVMMIGIALLAYAMYSDSKFVRGSLKKDPTHASGIDRSGRADSQLVDEEDDPSKRV